MGSRKDEILRGLGSGFMSSVAVRPRDVGRSAGVDVHRLELSRVAPDPEQPRKVFDEEKLGELAESLRQHGQLQPIRVRWDAKLAVYLIVAGERRYRASIRAGLATIDAIILDDATDVATIRVEQVVENLQRDDLTRSDKARAYRLLMQQWGCNAKDLAARLGVSESTISRVLGILKLSEEEQAKLDQGGTVAKAVVRAPRRQRARRVAWAHRSGRGRCVRVEGRPGDDVVGLLEAALVVARQAAGERAA